MNEQASPRRRNARSPRYRGGLQGARLSSQLQDQDVPVGSTVPTAQAPRNRPGVLARARPGPALSLAEVAALPSGCSSGPLLANFRGAGARAQPNGRVRVGSAGGWRPRPQARRGGAGGPRLRSSCCSPSSSCGRPRQVRRRRRRPFAGAFPGHARRHLQEGFPVVEAARSHLRLRREAEARGNGNVQADRVTDTPAAQVCKSRGLSRTPRSAPESGARFPRGASDSALQSISKRAGRPRIGPRPRRPLSVSPVTAGHTGDFKFWRLLQPFVFLLCIRRTKTLCCQPVFTMYLRC